MSARDLIQDALHSLEANKGRSLLTILGIVIGIASVIAMTSLIGGIQNSLVNSLGRVRHREASKTGAADRADRHCRQRVYRV